MLLEKASTVTNGIRSTVYKKEIGGVDQYERDNCNHKARR